MGEPLPNPDCVHQIRLPGPGGEPRPTLLCSCPAGLVHMHDCPKTLGLSCVHFRKAEEDPATTDAASHAELFERLMRDYLTGGYSRRIRSLSPKPDEWTLKREEWRRVYDTLGDRADPEGTSVEEYERERDRLREARKEREAQRAEKDKQKAAERERRRRGIRTVVEMAQETVAAQGNVATSVVDDVELPDKRRPGRRRGRGRPRKGGEKGKRSGDPGQGKPRRRRRRRKRRGKGKRPPSA